MFGLIGIVFCIYVVWYYISLAEAIYMRRAPYVIGKERDPYMRRWYLIGKNPLLNVWLHEICQSDDDRALHDHRAHNLSFILRGSYIEHFADRQVQRRPGHFIFRRAETPHRLELPPQQRGPVWTIFFTGPFIREWGFHCKESWTEANKYIQHGGCENATPDTPSVPLVMTAAIPSGRDAMAVKLADEWRGKHPDVARAWQDAAAQETPKNKVNVQPGNYVITNMHQLPRDRTVMFATNGGKWKILDELNPDELRACLLFACNETHRLRHYLKDKGQASMVYATHALIRTNDKGAPFSGRCMLCGMTGLSVGAALEPCENTKGLSVDQALFAAIQDEREQTSFEVITKRSP